MKLVHKLIERINDLCDLELRPEDYVIQRTYAGYWQRSRGSWSWFLRPIDPEKCENFSIGSQYPATQCAKEANGILESGAGMSLICDASEDR